MIRINYSLNMFRGVSALQLIWSPAGPSVLQQCSHSVQTGGKFLSRALCEDKKSSD